MNKLICIEHATKCFKDKVVFNDVNIEIFKGDCVGITGYNGCGKSVLMKCICGFSKLTQGEVKINGKKIGKDIDFIENAGVIIESPEFINDLSGYKNLKIIAEIQKKIDEDRILRIMSLVGLKNEENKKVRKYSLGMKQKLRIAQAIMEYPEILILDEPTNGLDKQSVENIRKILKSFLSKGGTILLASHNKGDIETLCNTVYEYNNSDCKFIKI
ncbi:ABC-2 type transport system ATP-binding protein [Eubacterium maltosivorans]|uniref:Multidrug ABC transporter ATP-binding protein n=1 Tax=Eubacterium maltosivorans TaxID=2041044 RepID=A0A4P9CCE4_EUBML|nr:ATP-binding cassette domain-containing protein [Eubacterium maltosivorans]QCT73297.1 multidrug ABC transporter ATP-binding protein [Eubacterium maltosivorans]WPK81145.1 Bacitracin transport ATP-binding protein BcrA [Eubacterium maltosivorans]SDO68943.1 ABC-2 type transport system ATP-binding protein [Eubacterium maltosivorans]